MTYFYHAKIINGVFWDSPVKWFNLLFKTSATTSSMDYYEYISKMYWFGKDSEYTVSAFTAMCSLLFFTTYLPTAVVFAVLSFTGLWALFRTFAAFYPHLVKPVAIAVLFVPSVVVWGSGIFKDTLCMFALGWLTYSVFRLLVQKRFTVGNILILLFSVLLVYTIKLYILIAFIPALFLWVLFIYTRPIKNKTLRILTQTCFLIFALVISLAVFQSLGADILGRYALENIIDTSEITREWIIYSSGDEGSAYDLGAINSPTDMILAIPKAINVTLFRPYLWESRKIIVLLSALESFLFLVLTLKVIFVVGPIKTWKTVAGDPNLIFCLILTFIFAFAVGISTGNFGSLSRYKIPCLPFYTLMLLLIYYKNVPGKKRLLGILNI